MSERLYLTIAGTDVSVFGIYSVGISTGRDDIYTQPDGSVLDLEIIGHQAAGAVGDEVVLRDDVGQIFRGWITDLKAELQEDMSWLTTLNATGPLAVLGQLFSGISYFPVETDSLRVKRVIDETEMRDYLLIDTTVEGFDLAERQEATNPINAAELARLAADSGSGVLWEQPTSYDKPLRYTPSKYRTWDAYSFTWGELQPDAWASFEVTWAELDSDSASGGSNNPPSLELDPAVTFADLTFEQTLDDLVRTVQVSYGPDDTETSQPVAIAGDGRAPSKNFTTILNEQGDAERYAFNVLDRQHVPVWRLSSVSMDLERMPEERQIEIRNALTVGTKITVNMPHGSPVGPIWQGFLEGWKLQIDGDGDGRSFIVDMHISDRFMTEPADRWFEIPANIHWNEVADNVTWADTTNIPEVPVGAGQ